MHCFLHVLDVKNALIVSCLGGGGVSPGLAILYSSLRLPAFFKTLSFYPSPFHHLALLLCTVIQSVNRPIRQARYINISNILTLPNLSLTSDEQKH